MKYLILATSIAIIPASDLRGMQYLLAPITYPYSAICYILWGSEHQAILNELDSYLRTLNLRNITSQKMLGEFVHQSFINDINKKEIFPKLNAYKLQNPRQKDYQNLTEKIGDTLVIFMENQSIKRHLPEQSPQDYKTLQKTDGDWVIIEN